MKFVKRITALFLAMVMVMAMGITASATTTSTATITGPDDGHTYKVYQILTADVATDGTLSNIEAGQNWKAENGQKTGGGNNTVDEAVAQLTKLSGKSTGDNAKATAKAVWAYVDTSKNPVATLDGTTKSVTVLTGYYLIQDNGKDDMTGDSYSTYIVEVVKDVTVAPKKDTPSFEKKVDDVNDSTGTEEELKDSADYDIGDAVPFTLTGTLPGNYGDYDTYYIQFTDQMEKTLTFGADQRAAVKVYRNSVSTENDITSHFTVSDGSSISSSDLYNGGTKFTVTCSNLKWDNSPLVAGDKIIVKYSAVLNENANIGAPGNFNEAKMTYSNNPNNQGEGYHGDTPWDNVVVFTYQTIVNKVDQDQATLTGAQFTLYKKISGTDELKEIKSVEIKADAEATPATFTFKGLDDGSYVLKETKTPEGYNTAADIEFTVTANHTLDFSKALASRTDSGSTLGDAKLGNNTILSLVDPDGTAAKWTITNSTGAFNTTVMNQKGSTLPSTGGMGTTVLYVAGIALIVVAGVVVIARKRNA